VKYANATVTTADVAASNGVIHVIDKVIIPPTMDIVATAVFKGHTILAEALTKAKLVSTLQGAGPFTVFAPTDAAFTTALTALKITKAELLARCDLADILKYHVLNGKFGSSVLKATQTVATLNGPGGSQVTITSDGNAVKFAAATITAADVAASNGVIHVIDKVVIPPALDIVRKAICAGHTVLAEALTKAKLVSTLQGAGPFTVFAPTDAAFTAALTALKITKAQLLARTDLADILKYHVLNGKFGSSVLKATQSVDTYLQKKVTITKADSVVKYANATVTTADVSASNGVIHVIDKVVLPPKATTSLSSNAKATSGLMTNILPMVLLMTFLASILL